MGSVRSGSRKASSHQAKRKRSRSTNRKHASKKASTQRSRSTSRRLGTTSRRSGSTSRRSGSTSRHGGSKKRDMKRSGGRKGKSSRGGKSRALVVRSTSGRSSFSSQNLKGKVTKGKVTKVTKAKPTKTEKKVKKGPKRPIGAFFFFASQARALAMKQKCHIPSVTEWAKNMGMKWRGMSSEEQSPFVQQAQQDKIRYEHELARFNGKKSTKSSEPAHSGFLVFLDEFRKGSKGDPKDIVRSATVAWTKKSNAEKRVFQQRTCNVTL